MLYPCTITLFTTFNTVLLNYLKFSLNEALSRITIAIKCKQSYRSNESHHFHRFSLLQSSHLFPNLPGSGWALHDDDDSVYGSVRECKFSSFAKVPPDLARSGLPNPPRFVIFTEKQVKCSKPV